MVCMGRFGPIIMGKFTLVEIFGVNTSETYILDTHVIFFTTI